MKTAFGVVILGVILLISVDFYTSDARSIEFNATKKDELLNRANPEDTEILNFHGNTYKEKDKNSGGHVNAFEIIPCTSTSIKELFVNCFDILGQCRSIIGIIPTYLHRCMNFFTKPSGILSGIMETSLEELLCSAKTKLSDFEGMTILMEERECALESAMEDIEDKVECALRTVEELAQGCACKVEDNLYKMLEISSLKLLKCSKSAVKYCETEFSALEDMSRHMEELTTPFVGDWDDLLRGYKEPDFCIDDLSDSINRVMDGMNDALNTKMENINEMLDDLGSCIDEVLQEAEFNFSC